MPYKVYFSDDVDRDLREIKTYLSDFSEQTANRVTTDIIDQALDLAYFPFRCQKISENSTKRRLLVGNYSIFYEVYEDIKVVQILFVWHQSRDTRHIT